MIKENQKKLNRFQTFIDAIGIILSISLAWVIRFKSGLIELNGIPLEFKSYIKHALILIPLYLVLFNSFKLYKPQRRRNFYNEVVSIVKANILGIAIYTLILYVIKEIHYSRYFLFLFATINILLAILERGIIRYFLRNLRKTGKNLKHIIIIGMSDLAIEFIEKTQKNKHWGYNIIGIFDDELGKKLKNKNTNYNEISVDKEDTLGYVKEYNVAKSEAAASLETVIKADSIRQKSILNKVKILGDLDDFEKFTSKYRADDVFITLKLDEYGKLGKVISACEKNGIRAHIIPDYCKYIPSKPYVEEVEGLPIIKLRYVPLDDVVNKFVKRTFDIIGSLASLLVFSPILIITALTIKITSPGPIIFEQERVGLNRKKFTMYKFRSMHVQKDEDEKTEWTSENDPRKTKFGSFIRKTSIDELPQLFNVLKGDMSLIGPRPERPYFVEKFKEEIPKYMVKHQVRPGMSGWAQINGFRGDTSILKRIEHDIYYIENWSLSFDIKIMWLTVFRGFVNKNAY